MTESSIELIGEVKKPIQAEPGHPELIDDEYVRDGVARICIEFELSSGREGTLNLNEQHELTWIFGKKGA